MILPDHPLPDHPHEGEVIGPESLTDSFTFLNYANSTTWVPHHDQ